MNACGIDFMELVVMAHLRSACQDALVDRTDGGGEFRCDQKYELLVLSCLIIFDTGSALSIKTM